MQLSKILRMLGEEFHVHMSVEALHPIFFEAKSLRLAPDQYVHDSAFCRLAKRASGRCFANKTRSKLVAASGRMFAGYCPHGQWELAAPVILGEHVAAICYCGTFAHAPSPELRRHLYRAAAFLRRFIDMELRELASKGLLQGKQRDESYYVEQSRRYIERRYVENIMLGDLSELLGVHANYLGTVLKRATGKTFRELLAEHRLREAETLLLFHRQLSIGEIAHQCGFRDSNYFSTVFRRVRGAPPREWAVQSREESSCGT